MQKVSEYNNNAQFVRFLKYAKGSCAEVRNMLNICKRNFTHIQIQKI
ncbi:S23 ribosomal protein (fragment) [Capnocytophaga canimorsus]